MSLLGASIILYDLRIFQLLNTTIVTDNLWRLVAG